MYRDIFIFICIFCFLWQGQIARAESRYGGLERRVGLGCMMKNSQRIKNLKRKEKRIVA